VSDVRTTAQSIITLTVTLLRAAPFMQFRFFVANSESIRDTIRYVRKTV